MTLREILKDVRSRIDPDPRFKHSTEITDTELGVLCDAAERSIELEKEFKAMVNKIYGSDTAANIPSPESQCVEMTRIEKLEAENKLLREGLEKIRGEAEAPNPECLGEDGSIEDYISVIRSCGRIASDVLEKLK